MCIRDRYSQVPQATQSPLANTQFIGTQSTYPTANQFQFKHEQDPNFRSNSFIPNTQQQMKTSMAYPRDQDPALLRSHSYINNQKEPLKTSIVMDPKDRPLHTLQEFEFKNQIRQPIPTMQPQQPVIVTTYPERQVVPSYKYEEPKKRDEYCGLFTNSKPEGYQKAKISQDDNQEKDNAYWLCRIF
eukprot:TRINITY_DN1411_c0_g1_i1.p2 TRINITY_DN1411_c0_g1~~TRINITY_DN1411_c0_g1_i1.p2  ORF type:complete len:186 (+),score=15.36 TRINITY_DN1411_c0_g1_i1:132-689(+)